MEGKLLVGVAGCQLSVVSGQLSVVGWQWAEGAYLTTLGKRTGTRTEGTEDFRKRDPVFV
jgi:hypothetical protein